MTQRCNHNIMHVCHLTQSVSTHGGGISEAVRALAMAQSCGGTDVSVMSVRDGGRELAPWPKGSNIMLRSQRLPGLLRFPDLPQQLDASPPDIAHVHGLWTWFSVAMPGWAAQRGRAHIISPHGMLDAWALNHSRWKKRIAGIVFERRNLQSAACIHALCFPEAVSIRAYGIQTPICVIPNGVELPDLAAAPGKAAPKILLFLGRIHPKKGLVNALKAWARVEDRREWTFAIAGWDQNDHETGLKRLCDDLGLARTDMSAADFIPSLGDRELAPVCFLGPAFGEAKASILHAASAFMLPSLSEGLPMSILEAWAYALPVLMTDHCNLPEGFANNAAIRIGTEVADIARGMQELITSPQSHLTTFGANGRKLVEENFTWPHVASQMKEVHEWVLGSSTKPGCVK